MGPDDEGLETVEGTVTGIEAAQGSDGSGVGMCE